MATDIHSLPIEDVRAILAYADQSRQSAPL
jgi:hypothetical protein